jgi:hypothetical protein
MSELIIPIKQYARTAAQLATENPILVARQLVIESDTGKMKLGNGTTAYNSLPYLLVNGNASQFLKADGSFDSNSYLTSINGIAAGGDLSGTYQNPNVSGLLGYPLPLFDGVGGDTLLLGKDISTGDWTTIPLSNIITFSKLSEPLYVNTDFFGNQFLDIRIATASQAGVLSSSAFTTFTNKQNAITLTTTGTSGAATFLGATLNVPNYTLAGLGGVPTGRTLTINGTAFDLSANRSWNVGTVTGVTGTTNRITSSGGATPTIDIASTYVGQTSITTLGTIGTGTWQGSVLGVTYGGTGTATNFTTGSLVFSGASGVYTQDNANLFWDNTNKRLGVGITTPANILHVGTPSPGNGIVIGSTASRYKSLTWSNTQSPFDALVIESLGSSGTWRGTIDFKVSFNAGSSFTAATIRANTDGTTANIGIGTTSPSSLLSVGATSQFQVNSSGEVAIGTTINAAAILTLTSTTKGVLFPRMTTTQKNAIVSPVAGLMVYDTTLNKLSIRTASSWETVTSI